MPQSVALPFGAFERALTDTINQDTADTVRNLGKALEKAGSEGVPGELRKLREAVLKLKAPKALVKEVLP